MKNVIPPPFSDYFQGKNAIHKLVVHSSARSTQVGIITTKAVVSLKELNLAITEFGVQLEAKRRRDHCLERGNLSLFEQVSKIDGLIHRTS